MVRRNTQRPSWCLTAKNPTRWPSELPRRRGITGKTSVTCVAESSPHERTLGLNVVFVRSVFPLSDKSVGRERPRWSHIRSKRTPSDRATGDEHGKEHCWEGRGGVEKMFWRELPWNVNVKLNLKTRVVSFYEMKSVRTFRELDDCPLTFAAAPPNRLRFIDFLSRRSTQTDRFISRTAHFRLSPNVNVNR